MKFIFPVSIFLFSLLFFSCGNEEKKNPADSTVAQNEPLAQRQQTDSGNLEIKNVSGLQESNAVLYDANGKVLQKGKFLDNKPAGAWVKYDNNGNVINATQYFNGVPTHKLDPQDFNFIPYTKKDFGATFNVPKNWEEIPDKQGTFISFAKELHDSTILNPNFSFHREKLQPGDNLEKLVAMQMQVLHENVGHVVPIDKTTLTIDSCSAIRYHGTFTDARGTTGFMSAIILSGNDLWFLNCEAPNNKQGEFLNYEGVFESVLESFKRVK
jgi:hypothetical protein